jgi:hypothetical protein
MSFYFNDNDDFIPQLKSNNEKEDMFDLEKEESRLNSLNILQLAEYKSRQRRVMAFLEDTFNHLDGFKVTVNKSREWCKLIVYRIAKPKQLWIPIDETQIPERRQLKCVQVPGRCVSNEFEISLKDMHSMYLEVIQVSDDCGIDLYDCDSLNGYPLFASVKPNKLVELMLGFQKNN